MAANKAAKTGSRKFSLAQMPTKTSINLAAVGQKKVNYKIAIPAFILLVAAVVLFSKFLVIDRLAEVAAAQNKVNELQSRLDVGYNELAGFEDLNDKYAHYTYSGFTEEELTRTSRVEVLRLIRRVVLPKVSLNAWSLSSNELNLDVTANTLQEINMLAQALQEDSLVNYCTVNNANTNEQRTVNGEDIDETVSARVLVYLEAQPQE
jgi:hypothetical protein